MPRRAVLMLIYYRHKPADIIYTRMCTELIALPCLALPCLADSL
jgi:hypothetical protein